MATEKLLRMPNERKLYDTASFDYDSAAAFAKAVPEDNAALWLSVVDAGDFAAHLAEWLCLCRRAAVANVFMDPAVALAVEAASTRPVRILLVWHAATELRPKAFLVGVWLGTLRPTRRTWPFQGFASPVTPVAYLGTPVLDGAFVEPALRMLFSHLRNDPNLPNFAEIGDVSVSLMPAVTAVLRQMEIPWKVVGERRRARLLPCADPAGFWAQTRSKAHIKNLARQRRQLAEAGNLEITVAIRPEDVAPQLEEFLKIEASGWKGARGSALISNAEIAMTVRMMIRELATRGQVKIHSLRLDGRPVAMSILLYSGREAFTWRIAYDEIYRRFSPGIQMLETVTLDLLNDPTVLLTDSCNHQDKGFQAERWAERHDLVDLLIGVRRGSSICVTLLAQRERAIRRAKEIARGFRQAVRDHLRATRPAKKKI